MGVLALLTVALSGCTGDPAPTPAPEPTAPASTTSSEPTSATASPTPTSSSEPVALSPEETVRAWVKARNHLLRTGESADVEALTSADCATCVDLISGIADVYAAGGFYKTRGWIVNGARRKSDFTRSRQVAAALIFSKGVLHADATSPAEAYPEEKNFLDFTLTSVGGRWLVDDVVFLA